MKKRYKTLLLMGACLATFGFALKYGYSFLDGSLSSEANQPKTATVRPNAPINNPEKLSKWLTDIQPAAGESK